MNKKLIILISITLIKTQLLTEAKKEVEVIEPPLSKQMGHWYKRLANQYRVDHLKIEKKPTEIIPKCRIRTGHERFHFDNYLTNSNLHYYHHHNHHPFDHDLGRKRLIYFFPFRSCLPNVPEIEISLNRIDTDKDRNVKINAYIPWKHRCGFVIDLHWADTKIYEIGYSYNAHHGCE